MHKTIQRQTLVPADMTGLRLDQVAARLMQDFSREQIKGWIAVAELICNGQSAKASQRVHEGDCIELATTLTDRTQDVAEDLPLNIVYQDEHVLVIDKPAGWVVHPGAGNRQGTLLNALLHFDPGLAELPRAGIVHRLDKDTSGLLVVARTAKAQSSLIEQLKDRSLHRCYQAFVYGVTPAEGQVDAPVGRHPHDRLRMDVVAGGKPALTRYRQLASFSGCSHLELRLATGRTHQIRVHMTHLGFPLLGDPVYRQRKGPALPLALQQVIGHLGRQALHACELGLIHPGSGEYLSWQSALPQDMQALLLALKTGSWLSFPD
ncbi:MAG: RluA family pseudouridine synthase [Pseudomonadales bacterium]|nr:RluA family pseudouridine synthase [Pseudomonadales bacterium]